MKVCKIKFRHPWYTNMSFKADTLCPIGSISVRHRCRVRCIINTTMHFALDIFTGLFCSFLISKSVVDCPPTLIFPVDVFAIVVSPVGYIILISMVFIIKYYIILLLIIIDTRKFNKKIIFL